MGTKPYYYYRVCMECGADFRTLNNCQWNCSRRCGIAQRERRRYEREAGDGSYIIDANGCWVWQGKLTAGGYGPYARYYRYHVGPIADGLTHDHLCRNRPCVNPAHLEPVTKRVNTLRGEGPPAMNARKTHCLKGHELTEQNTYRGPQGWRWCKECRKIYHRALRKAKAPAYVERERQRNERRRAAR